jgi:type IV pilus assembly protein PilV
MDGGRIAGRAGHGIGDRQRARGVGLIEVLVAILVLGIGMLGVAAMQAMTLRNSQGALERSQAVIQTYSILDSMRANRAQAIAGAYNLASMTCTEPAAADLVTRDQNTWLTGLKDQLGDSTCGQINCTAAGNCTITVQWDAERGGGTNQQLQTQSAL